MRFSRAESTAMERGDGMVYVEVVLKDLFSRRPLPSATATTKARSTPRIVLTIVHINLYHITLLDPHRHLQSASPVLDVAVSAH